MEKNEAGVDETQIEFKSRKKKNQRFNKKKTARTTLSTFEFADKIE